jgi:Calcineurin-like phosphoesterase
MSQLIKISVLAILQVLASRTLADTPPRLEVAVADPSAPLTFIAYGDTRFTQRDGVANADARRALVARMAGEKPAAIFIGGDLVYEGSNLEDYETYRTETAAWSQAKIPIFPALGNHEFRGCEKDMNPCLCELVEVGRPRRSALFPLVLRHSRAEDPGTPTGLRFIPQAGKRTTDLV